MPGEDVLATPDLLVPAHISDGVRERLENDLRVDDRVREDGHDRALTTCFDGVVEWRRRLEEIRTGQDLVEAQASVE